MAIANQSGSVLSRRKFRPRHVSRNDGPRVVETCRMKVDCGLAVASRSAAVILVYVRPTINHGSRRKLKAFCRERSVWLTPIDVLADGSCTGYRAAGTGAALVELVESKWVARAEWDCPVRVGYSAQLAPTVTHGANDKPAATDPADKYRHGETPVQPIGDFANGLHANRPTAIPDCDCHSCRNLRHSH